MQKVLGYQIRSKYTHLVVQQKNTSPNKKGQKAKSKKKEKKVRQPPQLC